ncbi:TetR/AcrR family transcriptional regulator [Stappia sp. F7233]|uniref:TetR/AcrR family transcriptional regulator n=1 Tax=Stappia albiluteola TaxID=2758565 RepID=A0A839AJV6_9HYPH|nr:TetR/AcrR family transcriptional regulator [Stappia albiluteola]MBA5779182.1 TetR/AcrR family transcriptional regulator [Stappia albiluteola]
MARHREFDEEVALAGALNVFWKRGYTAASMQELCEAMGLNPGSVYAAYGSKHDLFLLAMRRYISDVTREGIGRIEKSASGIGGIRAYFDYLIDGIVAGRRQWGCLGTNAFMELGERDDLVQQIMAEHFLRLEDAFRRALERDPGLVHLGQKPVDLARYLVCVAQGLNVIARTSPDRARLEGIVSAALSACREPVAA